MCLRAVQAGSENSAMVWISLASLVNAAGGTVRQIAWLGVLVMVPCTLWLLRKSRRVLGVGSISCVAGAVFVVAAMHWFARQPYTFAVSPLGGGMQAETLRDLGRFGLKAAGQLALMSLPVLLMFAGFFRSWNRRAGAVFAAGVLCFAIFGMVLIRAGRLPDWLAPFFADYFFTDSTLERLSAIAAQGSHLAIARDSLRELLTVAVVLGILSLVACLFADAHGQPASKTATATSSWRQIWIIAGPFSAATIVLLMMVKESLGFVDRYLLPLLVILLLVLARIYQERVRAKLPLACALLIAIFGVFSAAATHDDFAMYRGYVTAINEIRASGAPATAIIGLWAFEGWTQIESDGYVHDSRIRVFKSANAPLVQASPAPHDTQSSFLREAPAIKPVFGVSQDLSVCSCPQAFPPVMYRTWVAPHTNWIYDVRLPPTFSH
jgi:hypothetical protein